MRVGRRRTDLHPQEGLQRSPHGDSMITDQPPTEDPVNTRTIALAALAIAVILLLIILL